MSRFSKSSKRATARVRVERVEPVSDVEATAIVSIEADDGSKTEHEVPVAVTDGDENTEPDAQPDEPTKKRRRGRRKKEEQHG